MKSNQCTKTQYTKKEAQTELGALIKGKTVYLLGKKRRKIGHKPVRIYHCPEHNCWHLTSKINDMAYASSPRYKDFLEIESEEMLKETIEKYSLLFYTNSNCPRCDVLYDSLIAKGFESIVRIKLVPKTIYPNFPLLKSLPIIFYKGTEIRARRGSEILAEIKKIDRIKLMENEIKSEL